MRPESKMDEEEDPEMKPVTGLRYLPSGHKRERTKSNAPPSKNKPTVEKWLRQPWKQHRDWLANVKAKVDTSAPKLRVREILNIHKVHNAQVAQRDIENANKQLLEDITMIMRTHGAIDCHWEMEFFQRERADEHRITLQRIARENMQMLERINYTVAKVPTVAWCKKRWEKDMVAIRCGSIYPVYWEREKKQKKEHRQHVLDDAHEMIPQDVNWCFLDIAATYHKTPLGRIVIHLDKENCPLATANFHALCTGSEGPCYKGSRFHRIVSGVLCQAGSLGPGGGMSVFGTHFPDEKLDVEHNAAGLVCMANVGPNTNGSQFFITAKPQPCFTGKYVTFGKVVQGMDVLKKIMSYGGQYGKPRDKVFISNCGELDEWSYSSEDDVRDDKQEPPEKPRPAKNPFARTPAKKVTVIKKRSALRSSQRLKKPAVQKPHGVEKQHQDHVEPASGQYTDSVIAQFCDACDPAHKGLDCTCSSEKESCPHEKFNQQQPTKKKILANENKT